MNGVLTYVDDIQNYGNANNVYTVTRGRNIHNGVDVKYKAIIGSEERSE